MMCRNLGGLRLLLLQGFDDVGGLFSIFPSVRVLGITIDIWNYCTS